MAVNPPNVWSQMNYVVPRGRCNHTRNAGITRCPCLRFMMHPLKSTSSFVCDGCDHHASFHSLENAEEDEVRKRWEQEAERDKAASKQPPRKRQRQLENGDQVGTRRRRERETEQDQVHEKVQDQSKDSPMHRATKDQRGSGVWQLWDGQPWLELD